MNTDTISPFRPGDASPLQEKYRTLQHEAYAYKRQRDKLAEALRGVINGCVHPDRAVRAVMVDLSPIRAVIKEIYEPTT